MDRLADVLHELIGRVEAIVPDASYNLLLRTAPWIDGVDAWYHWRIEMLPRVADFAGLEIAAGIHINPLSPEHAARAAAAGRCREPSGTCQSLSGSARRTYFARHLQTGSPFPDSRPRF